MADRHPYSRQLIKSAATLGGGAGATSLAALLGEPAVIIASAGLIGGAIASVGVDQYLARHEDAIDSIAERLRWQLTGSGVPLFNTSQQAMLQLMERDFGRSVLRANVESIRSLGGDLIERSRFANAHSVHFRDDVEALLSGFATAHALVDLRAPEQPWRRLQHWKRPLAVSCLSVFPAIVAALEYMRSVMQIPLIIESDVPSGKRQAADIGTRLGSSDRFEYVFMSNADFLMNPNVSGFDKMYRFQLPVHTKLNYLVAPGVAAARPVTELKVSYVADGSAHEQFNAFAGSVKRGEAKHSSESEKMVQGLKEDEAVFMWEHGVAPLKKFGLAPRMDLMHAYWVSLFSAREGLLDRSHDRLAEQDRLFVSAFAYAWETCRTDFGRAISLLRRTGHAKHFTSARQLKAL